MFLNLHVLHNWSVKQIIVPIGIFKTLKIETDKYS